MLSQINIVKRLITLRGPGDRADPVSTREREQTMQHMAAGIAYYVADSDENANVRARHYGGVHYIGMGWYRTTSSRGCLWRKHARVCLRRLNGEPVCWHCHSVWPALAFWKHLPLTVAYR